MQVQIFFGDGMRAHDNFDTITFFEKAFDGKEASVPSGVESAAARKAKKADFFRLKPARSKRRKVTTPSGNSCNTIPSAANTPVKMLTLKVTE